MPKAMIVNKYVDPETGITVIEDAGGKYHFITPINVVVENPENSMTENKRLRRVLERLRMENNWLWEVVETAIRNRRRIGTGRAFDKFEKSVKEKKE